jgi:hypothetical protein
LPRDYSKPRDYGKMFDRLSDLFRYGVVAVVIYRLGDMTKSDTVAIEKDLMAAIEKDMRERGIGDLKLAIKDILEKGLAHEGIQTHAEVLHIIDREQFERGKEAFETRTDDYDGSKAG